jgi:tetratricopeptide (TPR) repeat protein
VERSLDEAQAPPHGAAPAVGWTDRALLAIERSDLLRRAGRLDDAVAALRAGQGILLEAAGAPQGGPRSRLEVQIELRLGLVEAVRGEHARAVAHFESGLVRLAAGDEPALRALLGAEIGFARLRLGDADACRAACLAGLRACRGLRSAEAAPVVIRLLGALASAFYQRDRLVRAERLYRQSSRLAERAGEARLASVAANNLAAICFKRGDLRGARDLFLRSLAQRERLGDLYDLAVSYSNLAEVALALGEPRTALEQARRAVELGERIGAGGPFADAHRNFALALLAVGQADAALRAAERAFELAREPSGREYLAATGEALERCITAARPPDARERRERIAAELRA